MKRILGAMFLFTCLMLLPILLYAHSKELIIYEKLDPVHKSVTRMHLYKCVDDLGDKFFIAFTVYCFALVSSNGIITGYDGNLVGKTEGMTGIGGCLFPFVSRFSHCLEP